jgi:predicted acetyltransferase
LEPPEKPCVRYLVQRDGQTEGYIVLGQDTEDKPLEVLDLCVLSPAAGRRLLTLFASHRSQLQHVTWHGGPLDPLRYLLAPSFIGSARTLQSHITMIRSIDWMLRIVDVVGALNGRGYPPGIEAELHFDVRDDILPGNNGRFVLQVVDGRGQVERGGKGHITLDIRDLAAIYSGFMTPAERCAFGEIDGPGADLALLTSIFAGPRPWMPDMF